MDKPKVATVWLEGCSGCHMSFLDLDEDLLKVLGAVELTVSPITDFKDYQFPEATLGIIEGAVGNEEHRHVLKQMRKKCRLLLAWGDCAVFGGINCLRNGLAVDDLLRRGYLETPSTAGGQLPIHPQLPPLLPKVLAAQEVVPIDAFLPGCPPSPQAIAHILGEILAGRPPQATTNLLHFD